MSLLIKNGRVIDPENKRDGVMDVFVKNGRVAKVAKNIQEKAKETINAAGKIVAPGLIDMHVHLREPGREDEETIQTGALAALAGGFTSIVCMPNTTPPCDSESVVRFIIDRARELSPVNVFPVGAITKGRLGRELSEIAELKDSGCVALSDDGDSVMDGGLMRRAFEYASSFDIPVITHCEDKALAGDGVMNEGAVSTLLGLRGIHNKAESVMIHRDVELAGLAGAKVHIAHVSTKEGAAIIANAKQRGITVTAEVTPHHLSLTDACCKTYDTFLKVNPPLRSAEDVKALKAALKSGQIDAIASDHAPHLDSEKDVEFDKAPFGMIGLETALALAVMELVNAKILTWPQLITKMSVMPSKILNLDRGSLADGRIADITIIDPEQEWVYARENIRSKSANSPFIGWKMTGLATDVIVGGVPRKRCS
ncbi:MAG: dihydroorotase [Candidatus Omnitrophota bacterium]